MPCENLTVDTGLSNGSWPIYVGFLSMLAHIHWVLFCRVFVGFFVGFLLGMLAHLRRVFVLFFGACGAHLRRFWAGFSWVFVSFHGFLWFLGCECGWKGGGGGGGLTSLLFFFSLASFMYGLGTPSCQCT